MKYAVRFLIFASAFAAVVFAYPGGRPSDSESEEDFGKVGPILVLSEGSNPLEDGFGTGFSGNIGGNAFNVFLASMQNMMKRLREQMAQSIPSYPNRDEFFGFSNIPEGANTTSTTKVINGHVVTVNETTYSEGDNEQGTIIRVRTVDIKPEADEIVGNKDLENLTPSTGQDETSTPSTTDRSVESVQNISDNEIPERLRQVQLA